MNADIMMTGVTAKPGIVLHDLWYRQCLVSEGDCAGKEPGTKRHCLKYLELPCARSSVG